MNSPNLTLFLGFDGVLHPSFEISEVTGQERPYLGPHFVHASRLAEILRPWLPQLDIIISSTWGRRRDLNELRALLPEELAARVRDAVHHYIPHLKAIDRTLGIDSRWSEIALYLHQVRPEIGYRWLAVDNDDHDWPIDQRHHLVHCLHGDLGHPDSQRALQGVLAQYLSPVDLSRVQLALMGQLDLGELSDTELVYYDDGLLKLLIKPSAEHIAAMAEIGRKPGAVGLDDSGNLVERGEDGELQILIPKGRLGGPGQQGKP